MVKECVAEDAKGAWVRDAVFVERRVRLQGEAVMLGGRRVAEEEGARARERGCHE